MKEQNEALRVHIWVKGRVQGVGFRAFVQQNALAIGVTGWARNVGYNTVEAVAEGPRQVVEALIKWCHQGPPAANVTKVAVTWPSYEGTFKRFDITY